jgi:hypothetical protein
MICLVCQNVAALLSGLEQQQQRLNEQRTQQAQLQVLS